MKKYLLALAFPLLMIVPSQAQLTVTTGLDSIQLDNLLTGLGVTITNVQINCHPDAYGEFSGTSEIPIAHGLIMTTGVIDTLLLGSNNMPNYSTDNMYPGDADLTTDAGAPTYNACIIEFDCVPQGDTLEFHFGFGSEEYPEYVGAGFNDIFAIYLTDTSNYTYNAALIPSTNVPVSIDSVNSVFNSAYYLDNTLGQNIQFDGLTQNLTAFAVVIPGNTYHFKIAIADALDGVYDSGVLLEAFSFKSTPANINVEEVLASNFMIYPLPADDYLQILSKTNLPVENIQITDGLGRVILNQNVQSTSASIDISSLQAGLYMITCYTEKGKFTSKIIVR